MGRFTHFIKFYLITYNFLSLYIYDNKKFDCMGDSVLIDIIFTC